MSRSRRAELEARPLDGWAVVITRPVGTATCWRRRFAAAGARPVVLPGLAIRGTPEPARLRAELQAAAGDAIWIFTSPVAADQARSLIETWPPAILMAVGQATAARLQSHGSGQVVTPGGQQDSEGLLALPSLQHLAGQRITLVTGIGGRGLLQAELRRRGAEVREIEVYARVPPRLDRRHLQAVQTLPRRSILLISSAEALAHLHAGLPAFLWRRLLDCHVVVSSPRLERVAADAGFHARSCARSALLPAMLEAAEQIALRKGCL